MNKSTVRALRTAVTIAGITALGTTYSGTAFALSQDAVTHNSPDFRSHSAVPDSALTDPGLGTPGSSPDPHTFEVPSSMPVSDDYAPGSGPDSDINHNYHDDLRPNSDSNTNANSSFAQCGSGYDDTAGRDNCSEKNTYDHRYDHDYSYDGDPDGKGHSVLGSLF
jgi:hypothetical protein